MAKGRAWGAPAYGYRRRSDGHWEPHAEEAPIARRVVALYLETGSYNGVATTLNRDQVRPRNGRVWTSTMVKNVVTGRHVLGEFRHGGEWHLGEHPAIVEAEQWEAAQRLAEQSRRYTPNGGGRLPHRHIFVRGMLRCGLCGSAMLPRSDSRSRQETYWCATRKTMGAGACAMPILQRADVEMTALTMFEDRALSVEKTRQHIAAQIDARSAEARAQADRAGREAAELRAQRARVERDYRRGALPAESYARIGAAIDEELAGVEAEAERLTANAAQLADGLAELDAEHEALSLLSELRVAVASRVRDAGTDVAPLRAALAAVFTAVHVVPEGRLFANSDPDDWRPELHRRLPAEHEGSPLHPVTGEPSIALDEPERLALVPAVRAEMLNADCRNMVVDPLQRVGVAFGANNQHGTFVWKYMTQKTLRSR